MHFLRVLNELDRLGGGGAFFLGSSMSVTALTVSGMKWEVGSGWPLVLGGDSLLKLLAPSSSASTFSRRRASNASNSFEPRDTSGVFVTAGETVCTCRGTAGHDSELCCSGSCWPRFTSWLNFDGRRRGFCFVLLVMAPVVDLMTGLACWGCVCVSGGGWDFTRRDPALWRGSVLSALSPDFLLNELVLCGGFGGGGFIWPVELCRELMSSIGVGRAVL